jgi:hypothetical protein
MRSTLPTAAGGGSLTPQLEGAPRTTPHPVRHRPGGAATQEKKEGGSYA